MLKWGLVFVAGIVGLLVLGALAAQELLALVLPGVQIVEAILLAGLAVLAVLAGIVGAVVVGARWAFRTGMAAVRKLMDVPQQERFDSASAFQEDIAQPQPDDELTQAAERIRRLKKAAHGLADRPLGASLERLAEVAERLLTEAGASRSAKRRLRRQLVHHLAHVEAVALSLFRMQESGTPDPALTHRAAATFNHLAQDFEAQRRQAAKGKSLETEARLDLLAQEIGASTGAPPPPPPPPPPTEAPTEAPPSLTPALDRLFGRPQG